MIILPSSNDYTLCDYYDCRRRNSITRNSRLKRFVLCICAIIALVFVCSQALCFSVLASYQLWIAKNVNFNKVSIVRSVVNGSVFPVRRSQSLFDNSPNDVINNNNQEIFDIKFDKKSDHKSAFTKIIIPVSVTEQITEKLVTYAKKELNGIAETNSLQKTSLILSHNVEGKENPISEQDIQVIRNNMNMVNEEQKVHNSEYFETFNNNTCIIVVQVHNRPLYLKLLIESLEESKNIEESIVIFSHDVWLDELNEIISKITKFRYMQIFFPFNVQIHPRTFPGTDPRDCSRNHVKKKGFPKSCLNEDWLDTYGHYREPHYTQIKHHWWWKINRVFEGLRLTRHWSGDLLFLEDDVFVAPDVVHVLRKLREMASTTQSLVLNLGNLKQNQQNSDANKVILGDWGSPYYNIGFAFNRTTWQLIKREYHFFCSYDDYNWDWTLTKLMLLSPDLRHRMLAVKLSRVYHLGLSGTHQHKLNEDNLQVSTVREKISSLSNYLFPAHLRVAYEEQQRSSSLIRNNGGYKDWRDVQLCLAISNRTASEGFLDRLQFKNEVFKQV